MLPDRAKFYDSLKNYNTLQHAKQNSMYGLEYDEHSYYKREGEPGNYRYYWTKQEYEAHLAELEKQRNKNMQAAQNAEADRWKRNDQNKIKEQQVKNNSQANPEADRWRKKTEPQKSYSTHETAEKKSQESNLKYNKEVDEIKDATKRLQEAQSQTDEQYNKSKKERQDNLTSRKEDLMDMSNYFRKNTSNEDFNKAFEEAKKNTGSENLYFNDGDIKYYDKDAQDKINNLRQEAFKLKQENADLGYRNASENLDPRTKASNENKYQSNYNEIKRLEREIEITENDMKEKAYEEYEKVLDQMYAFSNTGMGNLQTARERKALDEEKYLKEQEGDWLDQIKKKAKKFFS